MPTNPLSDNPAVRDAQLLIREAMRRHDAERDGLRARIAKLERCLAFFASVIKSGEPWTATCEREWRAARGESDAE